VRVTSSRLYGHSTVGGRRLKPPELTDSRWRLLVSRFLRGAGPRHATHEHRHPRRSRTFDYETVTLYGWPSHAILLGTGLVTSLGFLGDPVSPTTPMAQRPRAWHDIGLG
jgi:hypothetical protein